MAPSQEKTHPNEMEVDYDANDDNETLGLKAVLPEIEPVIQHFDEWIKKTASEKTKNISTIKTKLDILTNISPAINDPATASTFVHQLLGLAGDLDENKDSDLIGITFKIVGKLVDKVENSEAGSIVSLVLPFYNKLTKRDVNFNYSFFGSKVFKHRK